MVAHPHTRIMPAVALRTLPDLDPAPAPALHLLPDPAPAPAAPSAPPPPAKRSAGLNLGGMKPAAKAKAETTRTSIPRTPEIDALADRFAELKPEFDRLEAQLDETKAQLVATCFPAWLEACSRQPDTSSMNLHGTKPETKLLLSVTSRYPSQVEFSAGQEALLAAITRPTDTEDDTLARFEAAFEPGLTIALKFPMVPEEDRQAIIDDLLPIFEKHGMLTAAPDMKEAAAVCKQIVQPKAGFHTRRHALFSIAENLAIQQILPAVCYPKYTGLKK